MRSEFRNDQGASGLLEQIKSVLRDSLQLGSRVDAFTPATRLLGSLPEFDSMAVVAVLTLIEERFGAFSIRARLLFLTTSVPTRSKPSEP